MNELLTTATLFTALLGHDDFYVRDRASKSLREYQLSPKVQIVRQILERSPDPEITHRAKNLQSKFLSTKNLYEKGITNECLRKIIMQEAPKFLNITLTSEDYNNVGYWVQSYGNSTEEDFWEKCDKLYIEHLLKENNYDYRLTLQKLIQEINKIK